MLGLSKVHFDLIIIESERMISIRNKSILMGCCCLPLSMVHLSLVLRPRDIRVPGLRPLVCSISPTVSLSLDELCN